MFLWLNHLIILLSNILAQPWTYQEQHEWPQEFVDCGGERQSPININTNNTRLNRSLDLVFVNYDIPFRNAILENDGYTAQVTLNQDIQIRPRITGSAVKGTFILEGFHFHWGANDLEGTDHSINGKKSSFELHLVHYNKKYGNYVDARTKSDGLVVLAILFEVKIYLNFALQPIINALPRINRHSTSTVIIERISLYDLLPLKRNFYYRYDGSLTTPPCTQNVNWIVFAIPLKIGSLQISRFRLMFAKPINGVTSRIINNIREIQPINSRIVQVPVKFS